MDDKLDPISIDYLVLEQKSNPSAQSICDVFVCVKQFHTYTCFLMNVMTMHLAGFSSATWLLENLH
jgi:hypothetical protein